MKAEYVDEPVGYRDRHRAIIECRVTRFTETGKGADRREPGPSTHQGVPGGPVHGMSPAASRDQLIASFRQVQAVTEHHC